MISKDYEKEHELIRQELWCRVACAYVQSSNSIRVERAPEWADHVLSEFDKKFKKAASPSRPTAGDKD